MIRICDVKKYHGIPAEELKRMQDAHVELTRITYDHKPIHRGYTDKYLTVDFSRNSIEITDIDPKVKEVFTGGKGYCLRYLWDEVKPSTRWDSPENAITMSPGPLCGVTQYAGTGKTSLVGALVKTMDQLQQKSVLLAPTGRAAKVFSVYAGHPAFLHQACFRGTDRAWYGNFPHNSALFRV